MKLLLITNNATIQKLFSLSAEKKGDELVLSYNGEIPEDDFDVIFIDKELFSEELFNKLKSKNATFVLILGKNDEKNTLRISRL